MQVLRPTLKGALMDGSVSVEGCVGRGRGEIRLPTLKGVLGKGPAHLAGDRKF